MPPYQHWYVGTYRQKRNRFYTVKNRKSKIDNNWKGTRNAVGLPVLQAVLPPCKSGAIIPVYKGKAGTTSADSQARSIEPIYNGQIADTPHGYLRRKYHSLLGNFLSRNTPYRWKFPNKARGKPLCTPRRYEESLFHKPKKKGRIYEICSFTQGKGARQLYENAP